MSTQLITYDLRAPGQSYQSLWDAIKSLGAHYHALESVWFVKTPLDSVQVRDHLLKYIDVNDRLFVGRVTDAAWYGLDNGGSSWLKAA